MAREGLRTPLGAAIRQLLTTDAPEVQKAAHVRTNGAAMSVRLSVRRLLDPKLGRLLLVITFESADDIEAQAAKPIKLSGKAAGSEVKGQLEEELRTTRSDLQSTIEELQATNEELASANEEVQSVNEELQSSNEELQTSKEEAQSLNEELQTVNAELEAKLQGFEEANDDLLNLINSTDIAMVFLDNRLRVKRFSPAAQRAFPLIEADIGRPLADLKSSLEYPELLADAEGVLESLVPLEKEIRASDGTWYNLRIRLYRTSRNAIEGLAVVLSSVARLKQASEAVEESRRIADAIIDTVREPLLVLDRNLRVMRANRSFCRIFDVNPANTEGQLLYQLGNGQWDIPKLRELLEQVLPKNQSFEDFEVEYDFPQIGHQRMLLNARRVLHDADGEPAMILLAIEDVTGHEERGTGTP